MIETLNGYPGFAVEYDSAKNPYFKSIMVENLTLLSSKELGKELLKGIAEANPITRGDFPKGINVICQPYMMQYVQSGQKLDVMYGESGNEIVLGMKPSTNESHNVKRTTDASKVGLKTWKNNCLFHKRGSSLNKAVDNTQTTKGGTVCYMEFSNAQVMESNGAMCWPHIVLAHELIHSLHCLTGTHADSDEEIKTTGIGQYATERMSENAFRAAFKLGLRDAYGA